MPLIKYVGGKRKLAPQILAHFPAFSGTYWEPMCGGASIFCSLWSKGMLKSAVLADINTELMALYAQVQKDPARLMARLSLYARDYERRSHEEREKLYYEQRDLWNSGTKEKTPDRYVFLKATAFNGLWREAKSGKMNAPWGKYEHPSFFSEENVMGWHKALACVELRSGSVLDEPAPRGEMVYLDPPYVATFTSYSRHGFEEADQIRLLKKVQEWTREGRTHVGYSNSQAALRLVREHWPSGQVHSIHTRYSVNCDGGGRKTLQEILVVE